MVRSGLTTWLKILIVLVILAGGVVAAWYSIRNPAVWRTSVSPGELSNAHLFLKNDCTSCHTPVDGVTDAKCIACHAGDEALLQRQPTAFHGNITDCRSCHLEHGGRDAKLRAMDHQKLASILSVERGEPLSEAQLDCASCHGTKDRHFGMLGRECSACHSTGQWTIAEFQHPSGRSMDCAQCHKAPPSHYMEHFEIVSKRVAKQPDAQVGQCYVCHETTSWNDIKGLGLYKHH